jgi:N-acetylmuramoyl-L-alanine amidase
MRFLVLAAVLAGGCATTVPERAAQIAAPRPAAHAPASSHQAPLAGVVVGIDPGHNGRNYANAAYINRPVWNGRQNEACDTTGTETNAGYPEPRFTFRVATFLAEDLRRLGATVVMTRHDNHGVGPCINRRARILDRAHAAVAIDIHADGGPASFSSRSAPA